MKLKTKEIIIRSLYWAIAIIILVGLWWLLNLLTDYIPSQTFHIIVGFINTQSLLLLAFMIILLLGNIFGEFSFPLNVPAPLLNALDSILIIEFAFNLWEFIVASLGKSINFPAFTLQIILSVLVFVIVIIVGYSQIFSEQ